MTWQAWVWVGTVALAASAIVLFYATVVEPRWIVPARRRRWTAQQTPMSDEQYAQALGATPQQSPVLFATRRSLAHQCDVPPESIHPNHTFNGLAPLMLDTWESIFAIDQIERDLGTATPDELVRTLPSPYDAPTIGEWSRRVADHTLKQPNGLKERANA